MLLGSLLYGMHLRLNIVPPSRLPRPRIQYSVVTWGCGRPRVRASSSMADPCPTIHVPAPIISSRGPCTSSMNVVYTSSGPSCAEKNTSPKQCGRSFTRDATYAHTTSGACIFTRNALSPWMFGGGESCSCGHVRLASIHGCGSRCAFAWRALHAERDRTPTVPIALERTTRLLVCGSVGLLTSWKVTIRRRWSA